MSALLDSMAQAFCGSDARREVLDSVLRDGLAVDSRDPAGVYFGTRSGKLYASSTDGERWKALAESLPPICCVKSAVVGEA